MTIAEAFRALAGPLFDPTLETYAYPYDQPVDSLWHLIPVRAIWFPCDRPIDFVMPSIWDKMPYPPEYVQGIGQSGWRYGTGELVFSTADIDGPNHKNAHTAEQIDELEARLKGLPCHVVRSASGKGLHVRIPHEPLPAPTRAEANKLRRTVIQYFSAQHSVPLDEMYDKAGRGILFMYKGPKLDN